MAGTQPASKGSSPRPRHRSFLLSLKDPLTGILLAIIAILLGYIFNNYFYTRGLEFRVLEEEGQIGTLNREKAALEKDLDNLGADDATCKRDIQLYERRLGIRPRQEGVSGPAPLGITISITRVPPKGQGPDSSGLIEGKVDGLNRPETYKVVLYSHTDRWYIQPYASQPLIDIGRNGHWQTVSIGAIPRIILGGSS